MQGSWQLEMGQVLCSLNGTVAWGWRQALGIQKSVFSFIFEKEGEARFRQREREALEALTLVEPLVLATGGGAILLPENRELLATRGSVVYLITSVEQQAHRVSHARHRPLLTNVDPEAKLRQLMVEREPLYGAVADIKVTTDGRKIQAVAEEIMRALGFPAVAG